MVKEALSDQGENMMTPQSFCESVGCYGVPLFLYHNDAHAVTVHDSLPARFEIWGDVVRLLQPTYKLILWQYHPNPIDRFCVGHDTCAMFSIQECGEAYSKIVGIMSRGEKWELAVEEYNKFTSDDTPD